MSTACDPWFGSFREATAIRFSSTNQCVRACGRLLGLNPVVVLVLDHQITFQGGFCFLASQYCSLLHVLCPKDDYREKPILAVAIAVLSVLQQDRTLDTLLLFVLVLRLVLDNFE